MKKFKVNFISGEASVWMNIECEYYTDVKLVAQGWLQGATGAERVNIYNENDEAIACYTK